MKHKDENTNISRHNTLTTGTVVNGELTVEGDFRLDGQIEGNIVCQGKIVIGTKAIVKGNISCTSAEIMGKVDGDIQISGKLSLKATAIITGNIFTQTLEIEPNAKFNGTCKMSTEKVDR